MIITDVIHTALLNEPAVTYSLILPAAYHKTLYWLHGYKERAQDILKNSCLPELAEQHHMAVVIPDLPDTFYLNQSWNECYTEDFFVHEFLPTIQKKHALPSEPANTLIGGESMGGLGSLLIGSHYPSLFAKIFAISGAFIIDDLLIGNPEVMGFGSGNLTHFQNLFGDIPSLEDSPERNPLLSALQALARDPEHFPEIRLACGTSDMLYSRNVKLRDKLLAAGADVTWMEAKGVHDWTCFNMLLEKCLI